MGVDDEHALDYHGGDMTNDEKRLEIATKLAEQAIRVARERGPLTKAVAVIGDEADANAALVLRKLGVSVEPGTTKSPNLSMVIATRQQVLQVLSTIDHGSPGLEECVATPTPDRLSVLVIAFGGHTLATMANTKDN
jgi:hypothetical protein